MEQMDSGLTHFDKKGNAVMVDVSGKAVTSRTAVASGRIRVCPAIMEAVRTGSVKKGDVLGVARVAGIMGVKQTSSLIPMCHTLLLQKCSVDFETDEEAGTITAVCTVKTEGQTGVEMEALTGVSVALLTIYDMCKAIDKTMEIFDVHLVEKCGGKSGHFINPGRQEGGNP
jgi:cyclic pyranopterin phosphate synthase